MQIHVENMNICTSYSFIKQRHSYVDGLPETDMSVNVTREPIHLAGKNTSAYKPNPWIYIGFLWNWSAHCLKWALALVPR